MPRCFVTGAAGFIGSSVTERLINDGHEVTGIDCFTDYYSVLQKKNNISNLLKNNAFTFKEADLMSVDLNSIFQNVDYVFHYAAQPGVRDGFGKNFDHYLKNNIQAIKKILDAAKGSNLKKIIYASSSSVYGQQTILPTHENATLLPLSLYGATKLTCEHMCNIYAKTFNVPVITLRFFSVYGPKQRPDMAFHKFIKAILNGEKITINGDGKQSRDFTFINDIVEANILAMRSTLTGEIFNVGNGKAVSIQETISILESLTNSNIEIDYLNHEFGDVDNTLSDNTKAINQLGYAPKWNLKEGIELEYEWLKNFYKK